MKAGKCVKCNSLVERMDQPLFLLSVQNTNGRLENVVEQSNRSQGLIMTAYICSTCNYTELYQETSI